MAQPINNFNSQIVRNEGKQEISTQTTSINEVLPAELILHILRFLNDPKDLACANRVCKDWNVIASDNSLWKTIVQKAFPNLNEIDENVLKANYDLAQFGLSVDDAEPTNYRATYPILKKLNPHVENDAGCTILTLPKGLDLNKLIQLAAAPKKGNPIGCSYIWDRILKDFGNINLSKTIKLVHTNSVLKESRDKSVSIQEKMAKDLKCEMSELLPAMALCFFTYNLSKQTPPTRLFGDNPPTYLRTQEEISGWKLVVGGFAPGGLHVIYFRILVSDIFGAGAQRKF